MIINISTIINNYEWVINNQIAMDIIKLFGFETQLYNVYKKILKLKNNQDKIQINTNITMDFIKDNKDKILLEYLAIFDFFYELNKIQINKNTYLPNLYGILLISNI